MKGGIKVGCGMNGAQLWGSEAILVFSWLQTNGLFRMWRGLMDTVFLELGFGTVLVFRDDVDCEEGRQRILGRRRLTVVSHACCWFSSSSTCHQPFHFRP